LNHTVQFSPKWTSPTKVALGAIQQEDGIKGLLPLTGII
jgi:hypothetical protein